MVLFVNPLTPRVKPWVIQSFITFACMNRTLKSGDSLESCGAVLYCGAVCFSIYPLCNFVKCINSRPVTVKGERVKFN